MHTPPLTLAISPCPNDTFCFHAWVHGLLPNAPEILSTQLEDVETLNAMALAECATAASGAGGSRGADIIKVSAAVAFEVLDTYAILDVGAALGWGNGPLLVARKAMDSAAISRLAIPGERTTAALLAWAYGLRPETIVSMRYDLVARAVLAGEVEAGVCIHEERFTIASQGLVSLEDFGRWWEKTHQVPLPLGVILGKRRLGPVLLAAVEQAIRKSLDHAWQHPEASRAYVRQHAQAMEDEVLSAHIETFVTDHTRQLGEDGRAAMALLAKIAAHRAGAPVPANLWRD